MDKKKKEHRIEPKELKRFLKMFEAIGSGRQNGFIYMCATGKEQEEGTPADGILFTNKYSGSNMFLNLAEQLKMSPLELIIMAKRFVDHGHG